MTVDDSPGGGCIGLCFSVFVLGGPVDSEGISVSYSLDGSPRTTEVDPGGAGGGGVCVISVGSPDAEYPGCAVAIGPDIGDPLGEIQAFLDETFAPVNEICNNNPDLCSGDPQAIRELVNAIKCFAVPTAPGCPTQ
ncbi:MAG: hypothetical protein M3273_05715 [Actinomycetota bacterium]|nr:hypothetical protein [Actinomycetota bacterium]